MSPLSWGLQAPWHPLCCPRFGGTPAFCPPHGATQGEGCRGLHWGAPTQHPQRCLIRPTQALWVPPARGGPAAPTPKGCNGCRGVTRVTGGSYMAGGWRMNGMWVTGGGPRGKGLLGAAEGPRRSCLERGGRGVGGTGGLLEEVSGVWWGCAAWVGSGVLVWGFPIWGFPVWGSQFGVEGSQFGGGGSRFWGCLGFFWGGGGVTHSARSLTQIFLLGTDLISNGDGQPPAGSSASRSGSSPGRLRGGSMAPAAAGTYPQSFDRSRGPAGSGREDAGLIPQPRQRPRSPPGTRRLRRQHRPGRRS